MAINWNLYPDDIISNPGKPYVYFNSLSDEILSQVAGYFNQNITDFTDPKTNLSSVDQAFSFLKQVIINERAKEEAFLQFLRTRTEKYLELKFPSIESNWNDFVLEIQNQLEYGNLGIKNLEVELSRLKKNQENLENNITTKQGNIIAQKNALQKTQTHLQGLIKHINSNKFTRNSVDDNIIRAIVNRYKDKLLQSDGKQLIFDETELMALIMAISMEVSKSFSIENFNIKGINMANDELLDVNIESLHIDEDVNRLITNARTMPWIRESLINSFGLGKYATHKKINADLFSEGNELIDNTNILTKRIYSIFNDFQFPREAIKIVNDENQLAEIDSLIHFAMKGAFSGDNTGGRGAKPDNIIGYITIDTSQLNPIKEKDKQILDKLEEANNLISKLIETTSQENTTEYYKQQSYNWNNTQAQLDTILNEIKNLYGILGSCFLIEDSTKNYISLYTSQTHHSVHGGSLGANITDQLNKIETITTHGGISMVDKQWLTAAIINAGPNMIASEQKNKLENYLAMFAAILLFDSQINIAEEAFMNSKLINSNSTTHNIHLFSVNGGYYPLSFVLKLTYDSLNKGLTRITSEELSKGVTVSIGGFVQAPGKNYRGNRDKKLWDNLADKALKSTKIKMKFLVELMNVIQNLLPE